MNEPKEKPPEVDLTKVDLVEGGEAKEVPLTTEMFDGIKTVIGVAQMRLVNGVFVVDAVIVDPRAKHLIASAMEEAYKPEPEDSFNWRE